MAAQPPEAPEDGRILDPTPDSADIDRGITPITAVSPAKRTGALALAGVAMAVGIIWVNAGSGSRNDDSALMTRNAHADRPDSKARQVVDYEAPREPAKVAGPPQLAPPPAGAPCGGALGSIAGTASPSGGGASWGGPATLAGSRGAS